MQVKIHFRLIQVNKVNNKLEVVFPYGKDFYKLSWEKTPTKFKILYVAWLKLQNKKVPEYLEEFDRNTVTIDDASVEINLNECEKIPSSYPVR